MREANTAASGKPGCDSLSAICTQYVTGAGTCCNLYVLTMQAVSYIKRSELAVQLSETEAVLAHDSH